MPTLTLPNVRIENDVRINAALKDNGVRIDWNSLTNIYAALYADNQRVIAGPCTTEMDPENGENLIVRYGADQPQYLGPQRLVIRCQYQGRKKTYDMPAFVFVSQTADLEREELEISDPEVDVELEVREVSTSLLDEALDACIAATIAAEEAARHAEEAAKPETFEQIFQTLDSHGSSIADLGVIANQLKGSATAVLTYHLDSTGHLMQTGDDVNNNYDAYTRAGQDDRFAAIIKVYDMEDELLGVYLTGKVTDLTTADGEPIEATRVYREADGTMKVQAIRLFYDDESGEVLGNVMTMPLQAQLITGAGISIAADGRTISADAEKTPVLYMVPGTEENTLAPDPAHANDNARAIDQLKEHASGEPISAIVQFSTNPGTSEESEVFCIVRIVCTVMYLGGPIYLVGSATIEGSTMHLLVFYSEEELAGSMTSFAVTDDLTSDSSTDALSAKQGKVLAETKQDKSATWYGTQAEYDAIATKDPNVEYNIYE